MNPFKWIADKWREKYPPPPPKKYNVKRAKVKFKLKSGEIINISFTGEVWPGLGHDSVWVRNGEDLARQWIENHSKNGMFPIDDRYINRDEVSQIDIVMEDCYKEY